MKLKGVELNGTYKVRYYTTWFEVYDKKGNQTYFEDSNVYWEKREYDKKGNVIYLEDSDGYWSKREYDKKGNEIYYANGNGTVIDNRVKELTIEEIEKLLGYKITIKGGKNE